MTKDLSIHLTFEDVLKRQKQLRDCVEELIEDDRPCRDKAERDRLFDLQCRSCLGLEHHVDATFKTNTSNGDAIWVGTLTDLMRIVTYLKGPWTFKSENGIEATIQPRALWRLVLDGLYKAWALSRDRATSASVERVPYESAITERSSLGEELLK